MKLSDLDKVLRTKEEYLACVQQLSKLEYFRTAGQIYVRCGADGNPYGQMLDTAVVGEAVHAACVSSLTTRKEYLQTQLMLYGVDDFEGKK